MIITLLSPCPAATAATAHGQSQQQQRQQHQHKLMKYAFGYRSWLATAPPS